MVKDGIPEALCSLKYPSVHNGDKLAMQLGKGVLMAKIDKMLIESFQSSLTTEDCGS